MYEFLYLFIIIVKIRKIKTVNSNHFHFETVHWIKFICELNLYNLL